VPPCFELLRDELEDPDFLPPRLDAPGEFAIFAARSFDIPFSFSFSYCFSFFTLGRLFGMFHLLVVHDASSRCPHGRNERDARMSCVHVLRPRTRPPSGVVARIGIRASGF
jgi:hypothetical protein